MGHIEKHLNKAPEELILRLFKEWKLYSGCLYDDSVELICQKLSTMKFSFDTQEVITLDFNQIIGYGYNRRFEKLSSKTAKVIVRGTNEDYEIVTAYPDLENGIFTGEHYDFNNLMFNEDKMWDLFLYLNNSHKFDVRFVKEKKNSVRVYLRNYSIKLKGDKLSIIDNSFYYPKSYDFQISKGFTNEKIFALLTEIEDFKEVHNIFGSTTITDFVSQRL